MFHKTVYNDSKILVEMNGSQPHEIYEPLVRKMGGVWNKTLNGWMFDSSSEDKLESFITKQNSSFAEGQNKEYYTKFTEEPDTYRTPSSASSGSNLSMSGLNEAFDLIQELFDRVSDMEKILEEHGRKLNIRR
jgi:hypothetical protein